MNITQAMKEQYGEKVDLVHSSKDELIDRLIFLNDLKQMVKEPMDAISDEIFQLSSTLAKLFDAEDQQSVRRKGYTVYLSRRFTCKILNKLKLVHHLIDTNQEHLLTSNSQTLTAHTREILTDPEQDRVSLDATQLEEGLRDCISVDEVLTTCVRKN